MNAGLACLPQTEVRGINPEKSAGDPEAARRCVGHRGYAFALGGAGVQPGPAALIRVF